MVSLTSVIVVSDIHYAGPREKERAQHEARAIPSTSLRWLVGAYRHWIWLRDPFAHNHRVDQIIERVRNASMVVANGDFSCDTAFVGVMDDPAFESASLCLERLREAFGNRFVPVLGDHELGKKSIFGGKGGMRIASFHRAVTDLGIPPFWERRLGCYRFIGVTSSLLALAVHDEDVFSEEFDEWKALRRRHLEEIEELFSGIDSGERAVLFCHDPTALAYLTEVPSLREKRKQIELTIVGHLHSEAVFRASRWFSGIPEVRFAGTTVRRLSGAMRRARDWLQFSPRLCPSPAGIELRRDGGFLHLGVDESGGQPILVERLRLPSC